MEIGKLIKAEFIHRANRFLATVRINGRVVYAHIANTGRLKELLIPGAEVWLAERENPNRKSKYDLKLVDFDGILVSVDAKQTNSLFEEAILQNIIKDFNYCDIQREVRLDNHRIDFKLSKPDEICWVEAKSVTMVNQGCALFPDAPTERGRRHLLALNHCLTDGSNAAVVFIVQRSDASRFRPNKETDPDFSKTLSVVKRNGVKVHAYKCDVSVDGIWIGSEIKCDL